MLKTLSVLGASSILLVACSLVPSPTQTASPPPPTLLPTAAPTFTPTVQDPGPSPRVAAFYYSWYGDPQFDPRWIHWDHHGHIPPLDIAADYFPALGPYSSNDPAAIAQHMLWLRQAGIGVIIVSWWGRGSRDEQPVPLILQAAEQYGIKVAFHIEPYQSRTAGGLVDDIKYLYQHYGSSPAFFTSTAATRYSPGDQPRGMFFVWCIRSPGQNCGGQKVDAAYWQPAVDQIHALPQGGLMIANTTDTSWIDGGHFNRLYNYASLHLEQRGFDWARSVPSDALYIPSVISGFSAQRVNYSADKSVPRNDGSTYADQWAAALGTGVRPAMVTITSFNEWHEGSIIEPAAVGKDDGRGYAYSDFGSLAPDGYLALTRQLIEKYLAHP